MAVFRGQQLTLVTAGLLIFALTVSILLGLDYTNYLNARRKENKFLSYSEEVKEVNVMMENLEARFEITNLEIQAVRNRSPLSESTRQRPADAER